MYMNFSELLKQYLGNLKGKNQRDIVRELEVNESYLSNLKSGIKPPPVLDKCLKLVGLLELNEENKKKFLITAFEDRLKKKSDKDFFKLIMKLSIPEGMDEIFGHEITIAMLKFFNQIKDDLRFIDKETFIDCLNRAKQKAIKR